MEWKRIFVLCPYIVIVCELSLNTVNARENQKLLMILLDGFRWDYIDQPDLYLPGFQRIMEMGVKADYLVPVYPTLSYPNYYSLTTGLFSESHGMISNYIYDKDKKEKFMIGTNPDHVHSHWWNKAEPLWVSAEKQNKRCYMFFWPGCEVTIRHVKPTHCQTYRGPPSQDDFKRAIVESLRKLMSDESDLAGIYFELIDVTGHNYGPKSLQVNKVMKDIDVELLKLIATIEKSVLKDKLNVMLFSDHGMADMTNRIIIDISTVLSSHDYDAIMEAGPLCSLWPKPGREREVYYKLRSFHPKMHVYLQENLPERLNYKNDKHVAPITMIADKPYYIVTPIRPSYPLQSNYKPRLGVHGYDNTYEDMRGIFLGFGPSFKAHYRNMGLSATDLYQVMTRIISIKPQPNNGTWSNVRNMLTYELPVPVGSAENTSCYVLLSLIFVIAFNFMLL